MTAKAALELSLAAGIGIGAGGIILGCFVGWLYQRYLSPNHLTNLIANRQRRRDQNVHIILSTASEENAYSSVQMSPFQNDSLDTLSMEFSSDTNTHYRSLS